MKINFFSKKKTLKVNLVWFIEKEYWKKFNIKKKVFVCMCVFLISESMFGKRIFEF